MHWCATVAMLVRQLPVSSYRTQLRWSVWQRWTRPLLGHKLVPNPSLAYWLVGASLSSLPAWRGLSLNAQQLPSATTRQQIRPQKNQGWKMLYLYPFSLSLFDACSLPRESKQTVSLWLFFLAPCISPLYLGGGRHWEQNLHILFLNVCVHLCDCSTPFCWACPLWMEEVLSDNLMKTSFVCLGNMCSAVGPH